MLRENVGLILAMNTIDVVLVLVLVLVLENAEVASI
jgi:hypothetical protein